MTLNTIARLEAAQSDDERARIMLELSLDRLEPALRDMVWAAAVPHWFDVPFLSALLLQPIAEGDALFGKLVSLSFVEPFQGRGYSVHERTRHLLLDLLWNNDRERYRNLSQRAASYCLSQDLRDAEWRVEEIYHLLIAQPEKGTIEIRKAGWFWHSAPNFSFDKIEAMTRAVREHADAMRLSPKAIGQVLFWEARLDYFYSRLQEAKDQLENLPVGDVEDSPLAADKALTLGDVYHLFGEYRTARHQYEMGLAIYRALEDRMGQANCLRGLTDVHRQIAEYEKAEAYCAEALAIYRAVGERVGVVNCLRALGDVRWKMSQFGGARASYEEALNLSLTIGSRLSQADCVTALAGMHWQLANYEEARVLYGEGLAIYQTLGNRLGIATCFKGLGDVHRGSAEYHVAQLRYNEALTLYRVIGIRVREADCLRAFGNVFWLIGEYVAAQARYEEALSIYRSVGDHEGEADCILALGAFHWRNAEYPEALAACDEALAICRTIGNRQGEANCLKGFGHVYFQMAEYRTARRQYEEACAIYEAISDRVGVAACTRALSVIDRLVQARRVNSLEHQ